MPIPMQAAMHIMMQSAMARSMQAAMPAPLKTTKIAQLSRHIAWIPLKLSSHDLATSGQGAKDPFFCFFLSGVQGQASCKTPQSVASASSIC